MDALIAGLGLSVVGPAWLAPAPAVAAAAGFAGYVARGPRLRLAAMAVALGGLFLLPQAILILSRPAHTPVQDGLLITEAAANRLLHGLDPYGHDYLDDAALRAFYLPEIPVNPLLGHFVYPPGLIVAALPFRLAGADFAWAWLLVLPLLALAAYHTVGWAGVIAVALNPLLLFDYFYLFNDIFFLAAALAAIGELRRGRGLSAGGLLALALGLKQQAVILVPPILFLAWHFQSGRLGGRLLVGLGAVLVLIGLPFFIWAPRAFLTDTAAYFYGSGLDSYPIRGIGLPGRLLAGGVLPSRWAFYPAGPIQTAVVLPLLALGAWDLRRHFAWWRFWAWSALLAAAVFGLGRTLAPNYLTLVAVLGALALASALEGEPPALAPVSGDVDRSARDRRVDSLAAQA